MAPTLTDVGSIFRKPTRQGQVVQAYQLLVLAMVSNDAWESDSDANSALLSKIMPF